MKPTQHKTSGPLNDDEMLQLTFKRLARNYSIKRVIATGSDTGTNVRWFSRLQGVDEVLCLTNSEPKIKEFQDIHNVRFFCGDSRAELQKITRSSIDFSNTLLFLAAQDDGLDTVISELKSLNGARHPIIAIFNFRVPNRPHFKFHSGNELEFILPYLNSIYPSGFKTSFNFKAEGCKTGVCIIEPFGRARYARIKSNYSAGMGSHIITAAITCARAEDDGFTPVMDAREGFNKYRSHENENVWNTYFEAIGPSNVHNLDDIAYEATYTCLGNKKHEHFRKYLLDSPIHFFAPQFSDMIRLRRLLKSHFRIRQDIWDSIEVPKAKTVLYLRGTDKKTECCTQIETAIHLLESGILDKDGLFLQTDDAGIFERISPLINNKNYIEIPKDSKPKHTNPLTSSTNAIDALRVLKLLLTADKSYGTPSNLFLVARALRGDALQSLNEVYY